jgi:hypothetical protein
MSGTLPKCGKYWYQEGTDKKKDYLKIGCSATYTIRTDNLSSRRQAKCDLYVSDIKNSNKHYTNIISSGVKVSSTMLTAIALAVMLAPATLGVSTVVSIVLSLISGVATAVSKYTQAMFYAYDAKETYGVIKKY